MRLSKSTECTTPTLNPNVDYELWVITMYVNVGLPVVINVPPSWGVWIMGETVHEWGSGRLEDFCAFHSVFL